MVATVFEAPVLIGSSVVMTFWLSQPVDDVLELLLTVISVPDVPLRFQPLPLHVLEMLGPCRYLSQHFSCVTPSVWTA